jgi:serine/threonine protein phosphatase 1
VCRTLVISDIHGCYDTFNSLLQLIQFTPKEDKLILMGDFVDRGRQSKDVVDQVMRMVQNDEAIALRGNHDQRFIEYIFNKNVNYDAKFLEFGGLQTIQNYCDMRYTASDLKDKKLLEHIKTTLRTKYRNHFVFLHSLPHYYEDKRHIYVHAGLNPFYKNWQDQPEKDFIWIREAFINHPTAVAKMVVFGHTKTIDIHGSADIWFGGDKIGIDGGCPYGLQLNCLEIQDNKAYVTYSVHHLA